MSDLKRIEPIGKYTIPTCDGSKAEIVSHALSSGVYVSLFCDRPFMLTLKNALVLGWELVKLTIGARWLALKRTPKTKALGLIEVTSRGTE